MLSGLASAAHTSGSHGSALSELLGEGSSPDGNVIDIAGHVGGNGRGNSSSGGGAMAPPLGDMSGLAQMMSGMLGSGGGAGGAGGGGGLGGLMQMAGSLMKDPAMGSMMQSMMGNLAGGGAGGGGGDLAGIMAQMMGGLGGGGGVGRRGPEPAAKSMEEVRVLFLGAGGLG